MAMEQCAAGQHRSALGPVAREDFFLPRRCMREPLTALFKAAALLDRATDEHLRGDRIQAERLLAEADRPVVRAWTEMLWGSAAANPEQWRYRRVRTVTGSPPYLSKADRVPVRMPSAIERAAVIERYGRHCVFCGIPLIRAEVRSFFKRTYPDAVPWGPTNGSQHAAFQALWMQFDHLVPHCRGGDNQVDNVVVTCAGCNFGRMSNTIEELGLLDPRLRPRQKSDWDGLERALDASRPNHAAHRQVLPTCLSGD